MKGSTIYENDGDDPFVQPNITNMTVLNVMEFSCLQNFDTVACVR